LLAGGDNFFEAKLAVTENGDEGNEHGDLRDLCPIGARYAGFVPAIMRARETRKTTHFIAVSRASDSIRAARQVDLARNV
jgi:hypothetical protein